MTKQSVILPEMHIMFQANDRYGKFLPMNIYSLLEHNAHSFVNIHIVNSFDDPIKDDTRLNIIKISEQFDNNVVHFVDIDDSLFSHAGLPKWASSYTAYYKLLIPDLFPNIRRMLYIDVDAFVTGKLQDLYDIQMGDSWLAGWGTEFYPLPCNYYLPTPDSDIIYPKEIEIPSFITGEYMGGGVLLFNIENIREDNAQKSFEDVIKTYGKYIKFPDQDILAVTYRYHMFPLERKFHWGWFVPWERDLRLWIKDNGMPRIIHGLNKPWDMPKSYVIGREFWKYRDLCSKIYDVDFRRPSFLDVEKRAVDKRFLSLLIGPTLMGFFQKITNRTEIIDYDVADTSRKIANLNNRHKNSK
jgi:lipopolysaccharide biosynthesis glycosyltransferase